jgi:hypothetical protein
LMVAEKSGFRMPARNGEAVKRTDESEVARTS